MMEINNAYSILKDAKLRAKYDKQLSAANLTNRLAAAQSK